jgi:hypothetical protein
MSRYFQKVLPTLYKFGDETRPVLFPRLDSYVDILDQLKQDLSFYEDYTILSGERPDNVSKKLYNNPDHYWTFFLLNDHLRESGWPVSQEQIYDLVKVRYPHRTVTTKSDFTTKPFDFPVGKVVTGSVSGTVGKILRRDPSLGQMIIDTTNTVLDKQRTISLTVSETGFAEVDIQDEFRETFHSVSLWTFYKDDELITTTIERTLGRLGKSASFQNIPYEEGSEYEVVASYFEGNRKDNNFGDTEFITYLDEETGQTIVCELFKESTQYDAVHHYERTNWVAFDLDTVSNIIVSTDKAVARAAVEEADNAELRQEYEWVDINPYTQNVPAGAKAVTVLEYYQEKNNALKEIKVLKPDVIEDVVRTVYEKLETVT